MHIVPYTKKYARNVLQNCMMKLYSKSILLRMIVQFASFPFHWIQAKQLSKHVVVNLSAGVVFLPWRKKDVGEGEGRYAFVHSVGYQIPLLTKRI